MTPSTTKAALAFAVNVPLPLLYVDAAKAAAVATLTDALTSSPFATLSTYALLTNESVVNPALP